MKKYRLVAKKGEGTFSEVLKAQNIKDGRYHAIKCMKNRFENIDQVNNLREIQALGRLSPHEHVITLEEVLYDQPTGRLALVFELMDGNLYEIIRGRRHYLNPQLIKGYMWQLMRSLDHMHKKGIFHRDIKPENILVDSTAEIGRGLKLADFGSCRGIYSKQPYTEYISTRWYRAPECLLTDGYYGPEMDMWGAGCVMFEITTLFPLFPGQDETDQIARIHKIIGTKTEAIDKLKAKGASHISFDFPAEKGTGIVEHLQHASPEAVDLMLRLLKYDASERISARDAMRHAYFKEFRQAEAKKQQAAQQQQQQAAAAAAAAQAAAAAAANGSTVEGSSSNGAASQAVAPANAAAASTGGRANSKFSSPDHGQSGQTSVPQQQQQQQQQFLQQMHQHQMQQQQQAATAKQQQKYSLAPIPVPSNSNSTSNKGLPNIVYGSNADSSGTHQYHHHHQQHHQQHQQVSKHYNTAGGGNGATMGNSGAMMSTGGSVVSNTTGNHNVSSLPPIMGGGGGGAGGAGVSKGSSKHHKVEGAASTQRRRKKYRLNYAAQDNKNNQRDPNQVLRAYGLNNNSISSNNNSIVNGNTGGGNGNFGLNGSVYSQVGGNSKMYGGGGGAYNKKY